MDHRNRQGQTAGRVLAICCALLLALCLTGSVALAAENSGDRIFWEIEKAETIGQTFYIKGWCFDLHDASAIMNISVDCGKDPQSDAAERRGCTLNLREDVNRDYAARGVSGAHGFEMYCPTGETGQVRVRAYAHGVDDDLKVPIFDQTLTYHEQYTVAYDANGGENAPAAQIKLKGMPLKLCGVAPSREGCLFMGWATGPESGVAYLPGDTYENDADVTLYAAWDERPYELAYDANGGKGAPSSQTKLHDIPMALSMTVPTRDGFSFAGWTDVLMAEFYDPGDLFYANVNTVLSAVWTTDRDFVTIDYSASGGYGAPASQIKLVNEVLTLSWRTPEREGYTFVGWSTNKSARVAQYQPGDSCNLTDDTVLYAIWQRIDGYRVQYDANGGANAPGAQIRQAGVPLALSSMAPTRVSTVTLDENYNGKRRDVRIEAAFTGWNTRPDGSGDDYEAGGTYDADAAVTLYAQWRCATIRELPVPTRDGFDFTGWFTAASGGGEVTACMAVDRDLTLYAAWEQSVEKYTVTYDANGGAGAPGPQKKLHGVDLVLSSVQPTREGHVFLGWATAATGEAVYAAGGTFKENANTTLYAVWEEENVEPTFDVTKDVYAFGNTQAAFEYSSRGPGASYPIPYDPSFKLIYGDSVAGKSYYKNAIKYSWGGNCCGMSSTAALLFSHSSVNPSDYGGDQTVSLGIGSSNGSISLRTFIEAMQVAQYSPMFSNAYTTNRVYNYQLETGSRDLDDLYNAVARESRKNRGTIIGVQKAGIGAHALLAYRVEEISDTQARIYIYDCNYPKQTRYITLGRKSAGASFLQWSYDMGGYGEWGTESDGSCFISYIPFKTIAGIWENRGNLYSGNAMLSVNVDTFAVMDFEGHQVASVVDGRLTSAGSGIYEVPNLSMNASGGTSIYLPRDFYTVATFGDVQLEATMVDRNLSASVSTSSDTISFAVDDSSRENTVIIENAGEEDTYRVTLESGYNHVQYNNVTVSGTGKGESISISGDRDTLSIMNCNIESLQINGVEQVSYVISAYAYPGGTITPDGDSKVAVDGEQTYVIKPDEGCHIKGIKVDGVDVEPIEEYTFKNVLRNHTIVATFKRDNEIVDARFDADTGRASVNLVNSARGRLVCAAYTKDGRMLAVSTRTVEPNAGEQTLTLAGAELPPDCVVRVMLMDLKWKPLCKSYEMVD